MVKTKKKEQENPQSHSPSTIFVSNLPYSFTNSQLEETFSDVGPVRRCFMVTQKGSHTHKGFGFVQFAVAEDADRAVESKNGDLITGRKIRVKHAMHRPPNEQRSKAKANQDSIKTKENEEVVGTPAVAPEQAPKTRESGQSKVIRKTKTLPIELTDKEDCSEKQKVARTVVFGGLLNTDMAEEVLRRAKEVGTVCSITYTLPKEELELNELLLVNSKKTVDVCVLYMGYAGGLAQDGCRMDGAAVLYESVKAARASVGVLHQQKVKGGLVWARQLGGEGSKTQKWKLIVRNLPFKATVNEIRILFSSAGFVWDVFIPNNSETGLSKGFGFVKFTCKKDAENAIQKVNGQTFGKRPIAVDWAVPKKLFTAGADTVDVPKGHGSDTAFESDTSDTCSDDMEDDSADGDGTSPPFHAEDSVPEDANATDSVEVPNNKVDLEEETNIARKVLNNLMASSAKEVPPAIGVDSLLHQNDESISTESVKPRPEKYRKTESTIFEQNKEDNDLETTVFVSNLPFDVDREEVKQRFSVFGEVQSFIPVLHQITKRPRGTGFLKFSIASAADAAVSAANATSGLGIFLKGRQLTVLKALDKTSAHNKEVEKTKIVDTDQRNIYLAKEGIIVEGSSAADGVSASDMLKRQMLEKKRTTKLQSPNFHVSRTRLMIHNLPKSMTEKELKKLCVDAVLSRASKQNPVIRQIKFLDNSKKGKVPSKNYSRGVAFVEFTEHQHALVALRVLNNNPETFGPEHRPIVEFALDNVQTLKVRKFKLQAQQDNHTSAEDGLQNTTSEISDTRPNYKDKNINRKTKSKGHDISSETLVSSKGDEGEVKFPKGAANKDFSANRKLTRERKGKFISKDKIVGSSRKPNSNGEGAETNVGKSVAGANVDNGIRELRSKQNMGVDFKKRKLDDVMESKQWDKKSVKKKKTKSASGKEVVDKLDLLIEQYRSKFSQKKQNTSEGEKQGSRQLKRWFES
ncbi:hypothetical protein IFM89_035785 [Coptis chinensis]|uniref:RRM domain-containing protein n=1 Tax=Coptis chinensis TaxID=261450 RepID=A0A835LY30_9MAGN|nr:hypothetical protein IFM89_035785 [Coptis chinensis]